MSFTELTQFALLGTERQPLPQPNGTRYLDALQAQLDSKRPEDTLLSSAALLGLYERIGRLPSFDRAPAPERYGSEDPPRMSTHAGSLLLRLLRGEHAALLPEFLAIAARVNRVALPESLPSLLDIGSQKPELREAILPVLGPRGSWLAAQNPEWAWVTGAASETEDVWQVGPGPARLMFLTRHRRLNPARARELLASTWKEETPEERVKFIAALETGLTLEDESFLEAALDDKRKDVRRSAAGLLGRIADSSLVKRMIARAEQLLTFVPTQSVRTPMPKTPTPASIEVTLPAECGKAMQRDGIESKPPQGFGEKVWWLIQMLQFVPLTVWTTKWQTTPGEVLRASLRGEWQKEFLEAWTSAALLQKNAEWAEALFTIALEAQRFDRLDGLLAALSSARREVLLSEMLLANAAGPRDLHGSLLLQCKQEWSPDLSRAFLAWLRRMTAEPSQDWQLRNRLGELALRLAPSVLADAANGWVTNSQGWDFWSKGMDDFLAVAQFRADFHAAFTP